LIYEYENKDFIEGKSFEQLSHDLKRFQNELFRFNKMIESHENCLKINSLINEKGLIYVKNILSQNSEQNEQNSRLKDNKTSIINRLNESISEDRKSL
jgi:hypothetical protein